MLLSTLLATAKWIQVIPTDSTIVTKIMMISLFVLTFLLDCSLFLVQHFRFLSFWAKGKFPALSGVLKKRRCKSVLPS